ncbi:MAG: Na+ dependent nucleoside transporter N-terminal domain-containing protein, partial [Myxococcota bacterium]
MGAVGMVPRVMRRVPLIFALGLLLTVAAEEWLRAAPDVTTATVASVEAPAAAARAAMSRPLGVTSTWGERARSALGLAVMLGIAWLFSTNRRRIPWRLVGVGVTLQIGLGLLTRTAAGAWFFAGFNEMVTSLLAYTTEGSAFIFGDLARPGHTAYIAFGVLPTIIFFSSLMALFYHAGIMPQLVRLIALGVQRVMGTSGAETLSAAGNIFVGQTEAPLLIRPFIAGMTTSELMAVMTGGFATVAGG